MTDPLCMGMLLVVEPMKHIDSFERTHGHQTVTVTNNQFEAPARRDELGVLITKFFGRFHVNLFILLSCLI